MIPLYGGCPTVLWSLIHKLAFCGEYEGARYVSKKPFWCWVSTWACPSPSLGILFLVILVTAE